MKAKISRADESKIRQLFDGSIPKQQTPGKGTLTAKMGWGASIRLVKDVFKNLSGFSIPLHTIPTSSTHKRSEFGCMVYGSPDHYCFECKHPPPTKKAAARMLIELGKKPQNAAALTGANTNAADFEETAMTVYN